MQINTMRSAQSSNTAKSANSANTAALGGEMGDMFMKLLTTQLKAQDPMSPMDPEAFVGQLVQFNTLGQIVRIRELLEPPSQPTTDTTTSATGGR